MKKMISGIGMWLMALPVLAQEEAPVQVPSAVDADPTAMIVFALAFVVMIAGFFGYMWMKHHKQKDDE